MEALDFRLIGAQEDSFQVLWKNANSAQKVVHALLSGKHIDPLMSEEFRFLENHPVAWEGFFEWLGYKLKKSELGGSPFFYLDPRTEMASLSRLSRGATFLGLFLAWHFFLQGPGDTDHVASEEIFRRLVNSYPFGLLRPLFARTAGGINQVELSEDQAEKLRGHIRRELADLARYRFIDLKPNHRASWEDLVVYKLPALYRFWELALSVSGNSGSGSDLDLEQLVSQVWGKLEDDG